MPHTEVTFAPGEEKLADAFERIDSLWTMILVLNARAAVDTAVMKALLATHPSTFSLREKWQASASTFLPTQLIMFTNQQGQEEASTATSERIKFWDEALSQFAPQHEPDEL